MNLSICVFVIQCHLFRTTKLEMRC